MTENHIQLRHLRGTINSLENIKEHAAELLKIAAADQTEILMVDWGDIERIESILVKALDDIENG